MKQKQKKTSRSNNTTASPIMMARNVNTHVQPLFNPYMNIGNGHTRNVCRYQKGNKHLQIEEEENEKQETPHRRNMLKLKIKY